jgi:hypothetical protein
MRDEHRLSLVRPVNAARNEQRRLCAIIDSSKATPDEKYQALVELALLTGVFVPELADVA